MSDKEMKVSRANVQRMADSSKAALDSGVDSLMSIINKIGPILALELLEANTIAVDTGAQEGARITPELTMGLATNVGMLLAMNMGYEDTLQRMDSEGDNRPGLYITKEDDNHAI